MLKKILFLIGLYFSFCVSLEAQAINKGFIALRVGNNQIVNSVALNQVSAGFVWDLAVPANVTHVGIVLANVDPTLTSTNTVNFAYGFSSIGQNFFATTTLNCTYNTGSGVTQDGSAFTVAAMGTQTFVSFDCPTPESGVIHFSANATTAALMTIYCYASTSSQTTHVGVFGMASTGLIPSKLGPVIVGGADNNGNLQKSCVLSALPTGAACFPGQSAASVTAQNGPFYITDTGGSGHPLATGLVAGFDHETDATAHAVKATQGVVYSITINTPAAGTLTIFNLASASCTGTPATAQVHIFTFTASTQPTTFPLGEFLGAGICVKASVAMDYTTVFD